MSKNIQTYPSSKEELFRIASNVAEQMQQDLPGLAFLVAIGREEDVIMLLKSYLSKAKNED